MNNTDKTWGKRALSILLMAAMVLSLVPTFTLPAFAASDVPYLDANGIQQTAATTTELTGGAATTLTPGWYSVSGNVNYTNAITISGDVHIILIDGCQLTVTDDFDAGINVTDTNSLTIYAQSTGTNMGRLTAKGGHSSAGIGSSTNNTCGTITINGGTIIATTTSEGAGIGSGLGGAGGNITINGGTVTAVGGESQNYIGGGAGIGGGGGTNNSAVPSSGSITITGNANVTAIGGTSVNVGGGAGIGTGGTGSGTSSQGTLGTIFIDTSGAVSASGGTGNNGRHGAAIGYGGDNPGAGAEHNPGGFGLYTIAVTQNTGGVVSPANARVSTGGDVSFTITPDSGYIINEVLIDTANNPGAVSSGSYAFTNITVNHTIEATFTLVNAFIVSGGILDTDYTYTDRVLTITQDGTYTIGMTDIGTTTVTDRIAVASGVTANITLEGVKIKMPNSKDQSPFILNSGANVTLNLQDNNIFKARAENGTGGAGIQTTDATLTIEGTGSLLAQGAELSGAGIGGSGNGNDGGTVIINSGTVTAIGGRGGAGIGGSEAAGFSSKAGNGSSTTINGGTITAIGGYQGGAGIGGGGNGNIEGNGGTTNINGGTVTATAGDNTASAIGRGRYGTSETVTVNGTYWDYWTNTSNTATGALTGSGAFDYVTLSGYTFRYIKLEDTRPALTGTVNLSINPGTGEVTASVSGGNTGSVGTLTYTWSGGATGTGTAKTPALGSVATCTVTASGTTGDISASVTVYKVDVSLSGSAAGDTASITDAYGKVGDTISIAYTVGNTGTQSNSVAFTGGAVTDSGSPATYVIDASDAVSGVITIMAAFTHSDAPVKTVSVGTQTGTLTAGTAGSVTFTITTANITSGSAIMLNTNGVTGVTLDGSTDATTGNTTTIAINTTAGTPAGSHTLILTIDGITSGGFSLTVNPAVISETAVTGITAPAYGGTPVTTITNTAQYTGTVSWSPSVSGTFAASTIYTATITLTPKTGFTLTGVTANFFTVTGASSVSNSVNSGVITAVFPATGAASGSGSESGGSYTPQTPAYKMVTIKDQSGRTIDGFDTTGSVSGGVISIKPSAQSNSYVFSFNLLRLSELESANKGGKFRITLSGMEYELPFNMANIITELADFLGDANLRDYTLDFTIKKLTGDDLTNAQEAFKKAYPNGEVSGDFYDISFALYKNGSKVDFDANQFDSAVTFTLTTTEKCNAVFKYDAASGKFSFIPAKFGDTKATAQTKTHSVYVAVKNNVTFPDVKTGAWYGPLVVNAANKGLVEGYAGLFRPDAEVTRAEFVQMIVNEIQLQAAKADTKEYGDVTNKNVWYYGAIMKAKSAGLLDGFTDVDFNPNQAITREEMASVLAAVLRRNNVPTAKQMIYLDQIYIDYADMDKKYLADIELVYRVKLMQGVGGGKFDPKGITTRAQAATVQIHLLEILDLIDVGAR